MTTFVFCLVVQTVSPHTQTHKTVVELTLPSYWSAVPSKHKMRVRDLGTGMLTLGSMLGFGNGAGGADEVPGDSGVCEDTGLSIIFAAAERWKTCSLWTLAFCQYAV